MSTAIRLDVLNRDAGDGRIETVVVSIAEIIEVRDVKNRHLLPVTKFATGDWPLYADVVMRDGRRYTVRESMTEIAKSIWPDPPKCSKCQRPL